MTSRNRARSTSRRRGPRRPLAWFNEQSVPASVAIGGQAIVPLMNAANIPGGTNGWTVIRMIGSLFLRSNTINTNSFASLGIYVETGDAVTAGAVADPITDLVDWYYHKNLAQFQNPSEFVVAAEFDIRTSRKIRGAGRELIGVFENNAGSGSAFTFSLAARFLYQNNS